MKTSNEFLEVGHDFEPFSPGNLEHQVSGSLAILRADTHFDMAGGKNKSWSLSLALYDTITWNTNSYLDLEARLGRIKTDFDLKAGDESGLHGRSRHWVGGLGMELGHTFDFGNHRLPPQLQGQYTRIGSASWRDGATLHRVDAFNSFIGRIGIDYSYEHRFASGSRMSTHVGANAHREFLGSRHADAADASVRVSSENSMKGEWTSLTAGLRGVVQKNLHYHANVERSFGRHGEKAWKVNIGASLDF